jgi:tetratricopeptide (TPR) repeat protein
MFDLLSKIPLKTATTVAHLAIRRIMHLPEPPLTEEGGRQGSKEATDRDLSLVSHVLREIEAVEGIPVGQLTPVKSNEYVEMLASTVEGLVKKKFPHDEQRAQALLRELRESPTTWTPLEPQEPDTKAREVFEQGIALMNQGDHPSAERYFQRAIELEPSYAAVLHNSVVRSFQGDEDWQRAINAMRFVLRVAPTYALARNNLAIAFMNYGFKEAKEGNFPLAIEIYMSALGIEAARDILDQIRKNIASSFTELATKARDSGNLQESLHNLARACAFYPDPQTRYNLGLAYTLYAKSKIESDQYGDAVYLFERALDTGFMDAVMMNHYGVALACLAELPEAIRAFELALDLAPGDKTIQDNLELARSQELLSTMVTKSRFGMEETKREYSPLPLHSDKHLQARLPIKSPEYKLASWAVR